MKKKIKLSFIPTNVTFYIGKKEYNKAIKKHNLSNHSMESEDGITLSFSDNENFNIYFCVEPTNDIYKDKSVIVHEISHVIDFIFENHHFKCDELRAYLCQHIYKESVKFYDKKII